ncbi:hypothetical protein L7F22_056794 [Adiantum nelumboides]|nr:hypothetical protein [Adiantum nelumboides]
MEKTIFSWNIMMSEYVGMGCNAEVLYLFDQMQNEGIVPNKFIVATVLAACATHGHIDPGRQMHARIQFSEEGFSADSVVQTALVNLYGRLGELAIARRVFESDLSQDVALWNATFTVFTQHGRSDISWLLYSRMQQLSILPNKVTFVILFSGWSNEATLKQGKELHSWVTNVGLEDSIIVGTALINMYCRCRSMETTGGIFDRYTWVSFLKLKSEAFGSIRDWKAMVEKEKDLKVKSIRSDRGGEFLSENFARWCKSEGIRRQLTTPYTPSQNGVVERKNRTIMEMARAMLAHASLPRSYWAEACNTAVYIQNRSPTHALQDMTSFQAYYGRKPTVSHFRVFGCSAFVHIPKEKRQKLDFKSRKLLFLGYSAESDAYRLYDPDTRTTTVSRDVVFDESFITSAEGASAQPIPILPPPSLPDPPASPVITPSTSHPVPPIQPPDVSSDHALSDSDSDLNVADATPEVDLAPPCREKRIPGWLYSTMQREGVMPNIITFTSALDACRSPSALGQGKLLHACIVGLGFETEISAGAALLNMYGKCGSFDAALQIFYKMADFKDTILYNTMITIYVKQGIYWKALQLYRQMKERSIVADKVTIVIILSLLAETDLDNGRQVHIHAIQIGLDLDTSVGNVLVTMYGLSGSLPDARAIFNRLSHQDAVTFVNTIAACTSQAVITEGFRLHSILEGTEMEHNVVVGNALINMYSKCGSLLEARKVFEKMPEKNVVTWSTLIAAYAQHGEGNKVFSLYSEMFKESITPDTVIHSSLLVACSHAGNINEALAFFQSACDEHTAPSVDHLNCIIDLLGRSGSLDSADQLVRCMPFLPSSLSWSILVCAYHIHADIDRAYFAANYSLELDSDDGLMYVLLSNIYGAFSVEMGAHALNLSWG